MKKPPPPTDEEREVCSWRLPVSLRRKLQHTAIDQEKTQQELVEEILEKALK